MTQAEEPKETKRIQIPFSKCSRIESEMLIRSLGARRSNVVLLGETGTGKSSLAEALYAQWRGEIQKDATELSRRETLREEMLDALLDKRKFEKNDHKTIEEYRDRIPTLKLLPQKPIYTNLVGIREDIAAAELFGTLPGVFTDVRFRLGRIAEAQQSMLFIDELGYVPRSVQAQLLTTIQERRFLPTGGLEGHEIRDLDVWYVAALTPPYAAILPELFYRLGSFVIELRSLDNIKFDFPGLMEELIDSYLKGERFRAEQNARPQTPPGSISAAAIEKLRQLQWPGNLRQLENVIHRLVATAASADLIDVADIDRAIKFDPASYLASADLLGRVRELFRESAVENSPLTLELVNALFIEALESAFGKKRTKEILQVGYQKIQTIKGNKRIRSDKGGNSAADDTDSH